MADYSKEFAEGTDWYIEDGIFKLSSNTSIPYMMEKELYPEVAREGWTQLKVGGGYVLFQEEHFFHDRQLVITYEHSSRWEGPVPEYQGQNTPCTISKLKNKEPLKIVLFGDSIAVGSNASGVKGAAPYMPNWGTLFTSRLKKTYGARINFINPSVGGKTSQWGVENVHNLVAAQTPDLVIIAFGMNDGTEKVDKKIFKNNIKFMIEAVRRQNPEAEFILVASTVPNPETYFAGYQQEYKYVLEELSSPGIIIADMTTVHLELLKYKRFRDMTGNNINHPNDYLTRWHAQVLSALMCQEVTEVTEVTGVAGVAGE